MTTGRGDRRIGALVGLAIGDALGAAVEFKPPGTFEPVTGYRDGGPHRLNAGEWTDDTSLALALADSLATVGWDLNDQADRYLSWYRTGEYSVNGRCFDIGNATRQALHRYAETGDATTSGPDHERSAGNGSIMRLAPVPMFFADLDLSTDDSQLESREAQGRTDSCRGTRMRLNEWRLIALASLGLLAASCGAAPSGEATPLAQTHVTRATEAPATSSPAPPTTSIGDETLAYLQAVQALTSDASTTVERALSANLAWDEGSGTYTETHIAFEEAVSELSEVLSAVAETEPPPELLELHTGFALALEDMHGQLSAMQSGLESADDGTARRAAAAAVAREFSSVSSSLDNLHGAAAIPLPAIQTPVPRTTTTTTTLAPTTTAAPTTTTTTPECHSSYVGACVPVGVSDVDCRGGSGNGPYYVGRVTVVGPDVYGLDRDNDGIGCESS